jgi:hypothetical protein
LLPPDLETKEILQNMKFSAFKKSSIAALMLLGGALTAFSQIQVSFAELGQTVDETQTVTIVIELSEASLLEVEVPYVISGDSTATAASDYEIAEETDTFDNESPIVFAPGQTQRTITINLTNDDADEDDELIIVDLVANGLTNVVLGERTRHTVRVIDNDVVEVTFPRNSNEFDEGGNIIIPLQLSSPSDQDVEVGYSFTYQTASAADLDLEDGANSNNPITIPAGSNGAGIAIVIDNDAITDRNAGGADRETFLVNLTSAVLADSNTPIPFENEPFEVTIIDNDPLKVEIRQIIVTNLSLGRDEYFTDDVDFPETIEIEEFSTVQMIVRLVDPDGDSSETGTEIEIPISYGGSATRGNGDNDDYDAEDGPLTISGGGSTSSWTLAMNNDDVQEGDETIEVSLGTPAYTQGGDIQLGDHTSASFVIKDNDPVTLNFGAIFTLDDEAAAEDEDIDNVLYVPSSGSIIAEKTGFVNIPYFLSSLVDTNVSFDLEISETGTTATILDTNGEPDDEGWDFRDVSTSHTPIDRIGGTQRVTIRAGVQAGFIQVALRRDTQDPIIFGQDNPADLEGDETVRFTMSNANTDSSSVSIGGSSTYELTIRDLEDIDITALFDGTSPNPQFLENGNLPFDPRTGLFEAVYNLRPNTTLDPNQFAGYNSLKVQYRTSNYDAANPDAEGNDPTVQEPFDPQPEQEFNFYVNPPFQLRYGHAIEEIILQEGAEAVDNNFTVATADVIERAPYILRPLDLPNLNDFEAIRDDAYDLNSPIDWKVDFYSLGSFTFPSERIDPASNPERMRIYVSVDDTASAAATNNALAVESFLPQQDGSMLMIFNTRGSNTVQVQYMDPSPDPEWKIAHPQAIQMNGASQLYWLDKGPPATEVPPSEVDFRLYRLINLN